MAADSPGESMLWPIMLVYFICLACILMFAFFKRKQKGTEDVLVDHYLAGRKLGPITLGFSLCASMFSGYTVVGLPAEAYKQGFSAWRWVGSCTFISVVYISYAPRLHWLSFERRYDSVLSFVWDRYGITDPRRDPLHWLMVFVVLVPCFIYLCAQFDAFANTISSLSDGAISPIVGAVILLVVVVLFELLGGLQAVSYTDVIQGGLLVTGAMMILVFVDTVFGGLPTITKQLENESPGHVTVMDADKGLSWAEFWIGVGFQRALFPDYIQRAMAAESQTTLRQANGILALAPFVIQIPLCLFGIVGAVYHPGVENAKSVFSKVVVDIINHDAAGALLGSVMMAACVAAIMSTADSVLIAVSHIATMDVVRPFQVGGDVHAARRPGGTTPPPSPRLIFYSRVVTLFAAVLCVPIVLSDFNLSFLIQFQAAFLANSAPVFILGLYWRGLCKWSAISGLIVGVGLGVGLVGNKFKGGILISIAANFFVTLTTAWILRLRRGGDAQPVSEEHAQLLNVVTWQIPSKGVLEVSQLLKFSPCSKEPINHGIHLMIAAVVLVWFALPFYREPGRVDTYLSGSPAWAVTAVVVLLLVHFLIVYIIAFCWKCESENGFETEPLQGRGEDNSNSINTAAELAALQSELKALRTDVQNVCPELIGKDRSAAHNLSALQTEMKGLVSSQAEMKAEMKVLKSEMKGIAPQLVKEVKDVMQGYKVMKL